MLLTNLSYIVAIKRLYILYKEHSTTFSTLNRTIVKSTSPLPYLYRMGLHL